MEMILRYKNKYASLSETKKNSILYTSTKYIDSAFRFVQSFILAKILGPTLMGEVNAVMLVMTYGVFLHLGTFVAMLQKVPYLRGQGEHELAERYKNTSFTFTILVSGIALIGLVVYSIFAEINSFYSFGIIIVGASIPLYYVYNFNIGLLRCKSNFKKISFLQILQSVLLLTISVGSVFFISNKAILVGIFLTHLITDIYLFKTSDEWFKFEIDKKVLFDLIKLGIPLIGVSMFDTLFATADRIMILKYLPEATTNLGFYSLAITMAGFYFMGARSVSSVVYQKSILDFGKSEDENQVIKSFQNGVIALALLSPLVGYLIEGGVFFIIDNFLNKYETSKAIVEILVSPSIFMAVTMFFTHSLITVGRQNYILIVQSIMIVFAFIANYVAIVVFDSGINGVTVATSLSYFLYFMSMSLANNLNIGNQTIKDYLKITGKVFSIFVISLFVKFAGKFLIDIDNYSFYLLGLNLEGIIYFTFTGFVYGFFVYLVMFKFRLVKK